MKAAACIALSLVCAASAAQQTTVEASHGIEHLSNGSPDWRASSVTVRRALDRSTHGASLALGLNRTERFGLDDTQVAATFVTPLSERLVATFDANGSATHRILPESSFGTTLQYEFADAWLVHGGVRTTRYDNVRINQTALMFERYTGPFSWAAGWRQARAFGTYARGGELRGTYFYGDRHSVGLIVAAGREATNIGGLVTLTSGRSVVLLGRHWLRQDLALTYSASHAREGDYYNRNGVNLGLQLVF